MDITLKDIGTVAKYYLGKIKSFAPTVQETLIEMWGSASRSTIAPYQHHIVHRGINLVANTAMTAPFVVYNKGNIDKEPVQSHPVLDLFDSPSPVLSGNLLWLGTLIHYQLQGEAFWLIVDSITGAPSQIQILDPNAMTQVISRGEVVRWMYVANGKTKDFTPKQIIHFKQFNPYNQYRGLSPFVTTALRLIMTDSSAITYNVDFFKNNGIPTGLLKFPMTIDKGTRERTLTEWKGRHEEKGNIGVLVGDMTYESVGMTQREMDFIESRKYTRDELCSIVGVSAAALGFVEDVNRANGEVQVQNLWNNTIIPIVKVVESQLNSDFFPTFYPDLRCYQDRSKILCLQRDINERIDAGHKLWTMGVPVSVINERFSLGLPALDVEYMPFNLIPMGVEPMPDIEPSKALPLIQKGYTDARRAQARQFVKIQGKHERLFYSKLSRFFYEQRNMVLSALFPGEKAMQKDILPIFDEIMLHREDQDKKLVKYAKPLYEGATDDAVLFAYDMIDIEPQMLDYSHIILAKLNKIKGINNTVYSQIRKSIEKSVAAGDSVDEMQINIKKIYNMAGTRARTIARTESAQTMNEASYGVYTQEGVKTKTWIGGTRPSHAQLNGVTISISARFDNGLMYPGDPAGRPEEVINCRCSIAANIK